MAVTGACVECGGGRWGEPCVFAFALQWVWVRSSCLAVLGTQRDSQPGTRPTTAPPCRPPTRASVVIWNVRSQGDSLLIRQTQTGNLYKHKRIHFQKNKLLRGGRKKGSTLFFLINMQFCSPKT